QDTSFRTDDVLAALVFVRDQAKALGEPWAANLSLGGHGGTYDGTSPLELAIDDLLASSTGCHIVVASGNSGLRKMHGSGLLSEGAELVIPFVANEANAGIN